jgi:predicted nucleic acid-binding protein
MSGPDLDELALIDACSVINLWASRRIEEIMMSSTLVFGVTDIVVGEALHVRRVVAGPDEDEFEQIDLEPLLARGLITKLSLENERELSRFIEFASEIDDGEAATCALAVERNHAVVTDDRKTRRILREHFPSITTITTSGLLKSWATDEDVPDSVVCQVLRDIREFARFAPGRQDPYREWWLDLLSRPE